MQNGYNSALRMVCPAFGLTIGVSLLTIVLSLFVYQGIKQKFFPAAERNQFVVELWMPTGTKLDKTRPGDP